MTHWDDRDGIDLDGGAEEQFGDLDRDTGGRLLGEARAIGPVHRREVVQRAQPDGRANDVGEVTPGPREHGLDVVEGQRRLLLDLAHRAIVRVGAELARDEAEAGAITPAEYGRPAATGASTIFFMRTFLSDEVSSRQWAVGVASRRTQVLISCYCLLSTAHFGASAMRTLCDGR